MRKIKTNVKNMMKIAGELLQNEADEEFSTRKKK